MPNQSRLAAAAARGATIAALALALVAAATPAGAQEISENRAWQFETPQEIAARTALLDLIVKRGAGIYAAPVYNTTIARQYNCSVAATAAGNSGSQAATANAPIVTGAASTATGNAATVQNGGEAETAIDSAQRNSGPIGSTAIGSTSASADGSAWQALNSTQSNSGDQRAQVQGSTACGFGALN